MVIDQRNAGASTTPSASNTYNLDRWVTEFSQVSKLTVQQNYGSVTPPAGFTNYLGIKVAATATVGAGDYFVLQQRIEGFNTADLAWGTASAKTVTLSFWVYSNITGTFGGNIQNNGGTRNYPFNYTISAANTWEQKTITIAGDTSGSWQTTNLLGIDVYFSLGTGTTYSGAANTWATGPFLSTTGATSIMGSTSNYWYITGVQLEVGVSATDFERRLYGYELMLCQRYCFKYTVATNYGPYFMAHGINTTQGRGLLKFPQTMRTNPSLTFPAASQFLWSFGNALSAIYLAEQGYDQSSIDFTTTGLAANGGYMVTSNANTTSYILASAEL
jgi:hypothetical protein